MSVLPVSNVCLCFLFLLLSAPSSHSLSFLGTPLRSSPMTSSIRTRATTTMLVAPSGSDSFPQILTSESPTASRIRTLPTPLRKMANVAAVPLAGAVGATLGAGGGVIGRVVFGAACKFLFLLLTTFTALSVGEWCWLASDSWKRAIVYRLYTDNITDSIQTLSDCECPSN